MSDIVFCDVCGCHVTRKQAIDRCWGQLWGKPCCSVACASVLYDPRYVAAAFFHMLPVAKAETR
jgi:hypothetical protein